MRRLPAFVVNSNRRQVRAHFLKSAHRFLYVRDSQRRHDPVLIPSSRARPVRVFPRLPAKPRKSPRAAAPAPRPLPKYITHARAGENHAAANPASRALPPLSPAPVCPANFRKLESTLDACASLPLLGLSAFRIRQSPCFCASLHAGPTESCSTPNVYAKRIPLPAPAPPLRAAMTPPTAAHRQSKYSRDRQSAKNAFWPGVPCPRRTK